MLILASSACFLYCCRRTVSKSNFQCPDLLPLQPTHIQPNAADGANFLLRQRGEDTANDGTLACGRAGVQHRLAAVHLDLHILALADGRADIDGRVGGLADEDLAVVALGREPDETCCGWCQLDPAIERKCGYGSRSNDILKIACSCLRFFDGELTGRK